jgi:uncharacterized protein YjbI with pentapeptide repeats
MMNMKSCKYNCVGIERDFECGKEVWLGSDYCVLHVDFPRNKDSIEYKELSVEKEKKLKEKAAKGDFNFEGAILEGIDFYQQPILMLNCRKAHIHGDVNFGGSVIYGEVRFSQSKICGHVNFSWTTINGDVYFNNAEIDGELNFSYSKKIKIADFGHIIVKKNVDFNHAEIGNYINFIGANIEGKFMLIDARVGGEAKFDGTKILGDAYFNRAKFNLNPDICIYNNFNRIKLFGDSYFPDIEVKVETGFVDSSFKSSGIFEGINKYGLSFEGARLKNTCFRNCDLSNVKFQNVIFENCELSTSKWENNIIPEYRAYLKARLDARTVADTYRRIRQSLQQEGAYDKAGKFYVKEMNMNKEVYREEEKWISWILYNILHYGTGYGENLGYIFFIFLVSWIIYIASVFSNPNNNLIIAVGSSLLSIFTALFVYVFARKISR